MTGRKRLGIFLLIAGFLVLATAGMFWRGDAGRRSEIATETTALQDSVKRVNQRVQATNLKYRGFQESRNELPDSVKRHGGVRLQQISEGFNKTIRNLEMTERDIKLEIAALKREAAAERESARRRAVPLAATGVVTVVAGAILTLSARRVGA